MFSWWTFLFQTINFFVVLYILYKLFFKPLKNVVQKREEEIKSGMGKLDIAKKELENKEAQYQKKMQELGLLKEKIINEARNEAKERKERVLKQTQEELEKERIKQKSIQEHELEKINNSIKEESLTLGVHYISKLASEIMDKDIHNKLIERFMEDIKKDENGELEQLKNTTLPDGTAISIITPFEIDASTLENIKNKIRDILNINGTSFEITIDNTLIGGIKLEIENKIIDGSIQGKLNNLKLEADKEL